MNLFETQERLNALPPSPQTLQYLSAAAEGQNPNVPPWLALVRMTEIQKEMQSAQQMQQQPQGGEQPQAPTVKDQVQQASGIMTLQQQKQQAAMQQMAQQAAQGQPQQPPAGIASVAPQAFRHGGGVRHFQVGGAVDPMEDYRLQLEQERAEAERARQFEMEQRRRYEEMARRAVPVPEDPNVIQRREEQAMGVDPRRAFDEQQRRVQELQQRMQQEQATREQERGQMGRQNLFNSMIAAREGTRGARGSGLAGLMSGFGQSYMQGDQAIMAERRKSEDAMMKRQAEINELLGGVDSGRMGAAGEAAKRGYGYSATQAKAAGAQQANEMDAAKDVYGFAREDVRTQGRGATDLVKGAMGRSAVDMQGRQVLYQSQQKLLTDAENELRRLATERERLKTYYKADKPQQEARIAQQEQQVTARKAEIQRKLEELGRMLQGGAPAPSPAPVGASGSPTPTGGTIDPRLEAARFRERFPATR